MPRGDGTGPEGRGSMTGRGLGTCNPNGGTPGAPNDTGQGLGTGSGQGRGSGRGRGQGLGRGQRSGRGKGSGGGNRRR